VTQGPFDGLGSNLPVFPKESSMSPGGKAQEELAADRGCCVPQPWICSTIGAVLLPPAPAGGPNCSVHRCTVKRCRRSVEITLQSCAGGGLARCQDRSCKGNKVLKCVRNAWSSSSWVIARDAISAILLSDPATCVMLTGAECNICWRSANPRRKRCAASKFAVLPSYTGDVIAMNMSRLMVH
jgi:hypothetical protein